MVEGHQCHRLAYAHRKILVGRSFKTSSPNGRFQEGAEAINGITLDKIEVHGKNLFYFFGPTVVHIHFGMSGQFKTVQINNEPEPTRTTRLILRNEDINIVAFLSAMTVQHGTVEELYDKKIKQLGPDPLREDADPQRFWYKIHKSKQPIGKLLMDQSCIAGLGNIYRAEVLFKTGVHPEQPGTTITEDVYQKLWQESVWCLQRGFKTGSILTVNPTEKLGRPWTRRYVYNHQICGRCKDIIQSWDIAGRTVYACLTCQPLLESTELEESRRASLTNAGVPILFASKCAADAEEDLLPQQMTVQQLKNKLEQSGQSIDGNKPELVRRLSIMSELSDGSEATDDLLDIKIINNFPAVPGTKQLGKIATAQEAALEKEQAGENRAVEHIALIVDEQLQQKPIQTSQKKRKRTSTQNQQDQVSVKEDSKQVTTKSRKRQKLQKQQEGPENNNSQEIIIDPKKLRVIDLRAYLSERGLSTKGKKEELVTRLQNSIQDAQFHQEKNYIQNQQQKYNTQNQQQQEENLNLDDVKMEEKDDEKNIQNLDTINIQDEKNIQNLDTVNIEDQMQDNDKKNNDNVFSDFEFKQNEKVNNKRYEKPKKVADILKPHKLRVNELKSYLSEMGLSVEGKKEVLVQRLQDAIWGDVPGNNN